MYSELSYGQLMGVAIAISNKMPELTVTSEIYEEYDYRTKVPPSIEGNVISEFPFLLPKPGSKAKFDEDNDLDMERPQKEVIRIVLPSTLKKSFKVAKNVSLENRHLRYNEYQHSAKTKIALVGLQVWRGAFLLGDLLIHLGLQGELQNKIVMELGAGTGLTSFVASIYAKKVICTDIDLGGILALIKLNAQYNAKLIKAQFKIMQLDFKETWNKELCNEIEQTDVFIAADVIYDDDVTAAFISTIQKILNTKPPKTLYVVLEKRYVFTIEHLDNVAPCYETFLSLLDKVKTENAKATWTVEQLPLNFPKYFTYDRVKELVLWKISSKPF